MRTESLARLQRHRLEAEQARQLQHAWFSGSTVATSRCVPRSRRWRISLCISTLAQAAALEVAAHDDAELGRTLSGSMTARTTASVSSAPCPGRVAM
jgi:hypothetical protein